MNNALDSLTNYPFEKLRALVKDIKQDESKTIKLQIGSPTLEIEKKAQNIIKQTNTWHKYPPINSNKEFSYVVFKYLTKRFMGCNNIKGFNENSIVPIIGSREGLFNACYYLQFLQEQRKKYIIVSNPSYQVYQGSATINGYTPYFYNVKKEENYTINTNNISQDILQNTSAVYLCNPTNPQGTCYSKEYLQEIIKQSKKYNFMLIVDECYIDVYLKNKPSGTLDAITSLNTNLSNIIITHSLSKRSNAAGLRSGFLVSSDENINKIKKIRTYSGSFLQHPILNASMYLWEDEEHVENTRNFYKKNLTIANSIFKGYKGYNEHQAGFFIWLKVKNPLDLVKTIYKQLNILTLPGEYLCNTVNDINPGVNYIRIALVYDELTTKKALKAIKNIIDTQNFAVK